MATINDKISNLTTLRNTLAILTSLYQRCDREQLRLITDNTFDYDETKVENVREFIATEIDDVEEDISEILNTSGV